MTDLQEPGVGGLLDPAAVDQPVNRPTRRAPGALNVSKLRDLLPVDGFKEYWYPALLDKKVSKRKPLLLKIAGEELVLFRDAKGEVVALTNRCVHRGGYMSEGSCEFTGTVSCPYHGWTFDGSGACVAVLGEGSSSRIPGMPKAVLRKYPTRTLKGLVFVWMGQSEPVPIEEDVPEQFFDDDSLIHFSITEWICNWRPAMENMVDAHVFFLHRNSMLVLRCTTKAMLAFLNLGPTRPKPQIINERSVTYARGRQPGLVPLEDASFQDSFPGVGGALWPQTKWRLRLSYVFNALERVRPMPPEPMVREQEWNGAHLPCTFQADFRRFIFTRMTVPVDAQRSRMIYAYTVRPETWLKRSLSHLGFKLYNNWDANYNFSRQDEDAITNLDYDGPEMLSSSDVFPLTVRRLLAESGRDNVLARQAAGVGEGDA